MAETFTTFKDRVNELRTNLTNLEDTIAQIKPQDRKSYPNPNLRLWSGDIHNLEQFVSKLEDWVRQPAASESRRILSEIALWAASDPPKVIDEICADSKYLSDNIDQIVRIHSNINTIIYQPIKKSVASFVFDRIVEKDTARALIWSENGKLLAVGIERIEARTVISGLAKNVRKDIVSELLKVTSFANDPKFVLIPQEQLINKAEEITKALVTGMSEKALIESYKTGDQLPRNLNAVDSLLQSIQRVLVEIEWLEGPQKDGDTNRLWQTKKSALEAKNLGIIFDKISKAQTDANIWKTNEKIRIDSAVAKLRRMSNSLGQQRYLDQIQRIEHQLNLIDWKKPKINAVWSVSDETQKILAEIGQYILGKLKSVDAVSIVENNDIVSDMGHKLGWSFERFLEALGIVLREGLIEIRVAERK